MIVRIPIVYLGYGGIHHAELRLPRGCLGEELVTLSDAATVREVSEQFRAVRMLLRGGWPLDVAAGHPGLLSRQ